MPVSNDELMYWLFIEGVDAVELYLRTWVRSLVNQHAAKMIQYLQKSLTL